MQETSYQKIVERLAQCEDLARTAHAPSVNEKASALALGHRDRLARSNQLIDADRRVWTASELRRLQTGL